MSNVIGNRISLKKCESGMIVIEDIKDINNFTLLPAGAVLTEQIIKRLKKNKVETVTISKDIEEGTSQSLESIEDTDNTSITLRPEELRLKLDIKTNSIYKSSVRIMDKIFTAVDENNRLNFELVKDITIPIFNEITSNNKFIACIENLRRKNKSVYSHSVNVAILSGFIGKWMKLKNFEILQLIIGGLLHDIGLAKIPRYILNKKVLTADEQNIMKQHAMLGYELVLKMKEIDNDIKKMVLTHHEECNGGGYPFGLRRDNLLHKSLILSVADKFDEVYLDDGYNSFCILSSLERMYKEEISKLDYRSLSVFINNMLWNTIGRHVKLNNNRFGKIVFINELDKFKPLVKVNNHIIDLGENRGYTMEVL